MSKYDESSIGVLEGLEAIRKRPGMYAGEMGDPALSVQIREAIDNATDEFLAGRNNTVQVGFTDDGYYVVHDLGQGIPVGKHPKLGISTLEVIFTKLHAGGKFNGQAYKTSGGCFTGDTEILLLSGKTVTLEQVYRRWCKNQSPIDILSYNLKTRKLEPARITAAFLTMRTRKIAKVHISDGSVIRCTFDHPFYVNSKGGVRKVRADKLEKGDSLVSTYRTFDKDGYAYQTQDGRPLPVHRLVASYLGGVTGMQVHHRNGKRDDNRPENLEILTAAQHHLEHIGSRAEFSREKILSHQEDLRRYNSERLQSENSDPDFIKTAHRTKIVKIAARALARNLPPCASSYDAVRRGSEPSYKSSQKWMGEKYLWKAATKHLNRLIKRRNVSSRALIELADMQEHGISPEAAAREKSWMSQVAAWRKALLSHDVPEDVTPEMFNQSKGASMLGRYAQMRQYTTLKSLKMHVLEGADLVVHDDLSEEARLRRAYHAEARIRTLQSVRFTITKFVSQVKKINCYTKESYDRNKSSAAPRWDFAEACIRRIHGDVDINDFVERYNREVARVELLTLTNEEPVYDLTVDDTHTFFVGNGVLVSNTHGVGNKIITALSTDFHVFTYRDRKWHTQNYKKGVVQHPVKAVKAQDIPDKFKEALPKPAFVTHGTLLAWKPDYSIIGQGSRLDQEWLLGYLRDATLLNSGYRAAVKIDGQSHFFQNKEGPVGYIKWHATQQGAELLHKPVVINLPNITVAFQQTTDDRSQVAAHTNTVYNRLGGNHVNCFWQALQEACKGHATKEHSYEPVDFGYGLLGYVNMQMSEPSFASQTKEKLTSKVHDLIYPSLLKALKKELQAQPELATYILDLATAKTAQRLSSAEAKAISKLVKQKASSKSFLPGVLVQASVKPVELFIVEGGCFPSDQKVALSSGGSISFEKLVSDYESGIIHEGVGYSGGKPVPVKLCNPRATRVDSSFVEVVFDDGSTVICTDHHEFLTVSGYVPASHLTEGDVIVACTCRTT